MTFSIIIPVYQVEKYLYQCLDSVINQSFTDYEVILIDDGSIDTSGIICDEYRMKYPNIQVIHQKHSGVSIARNNGINKAIGEYQIFIDSDDYIAKDSLKIIAKELDMQKLPDVMITKMITFNNKIIYKNHDP